MALLHRVMIGVCFVYTCAISAADATDLQPGERAVDKINGLSFTAPKRPVGKTAFEPAVAVRANWLALIPYAFVDPAKPDVRYDTAGQYWGESSKGITQSARFAQELGLQVMLKPHLWVRGQGWPGEFLPADETGWNLFLTSYRAYLLHCAGLAASLNLSMLSVGTELDLVAVARPDFFRKLIKDIRAIYGGTLIYAANWDQYQNIAFWDDLDRIGIDGYFPLDESDTPAVADLLQAWTKWEPQIKTVADRFDRPVIFTEFGYRSINGATGKQWELPDNAAAKDIPPNYAAQVVGYEAFFQFWWQRPYVKGGFLWKWHAPGRETIRKNNFTPQDKPAEAVVQRWFTAGG